MPLYGRAFVDTDSPGALFSTISEGSWEPSIWDYKDISGLNEYYDLEASASYSNLIL